MNLEIRMTCVTKTRFPVSSSCTFFDQPPASLCHQQEKQYEDPSLSRRLSRLAVSIHHGLPWAPGGSWHTVPHPPVPTANTGPAVSDRHRVPPEWSFYLLTLKDKHEDILPSTHRSHSQGAQPPFPPPAPPPSPPHTHICTCAPPLPTQRRL